MTTEYDRLVCENNALKQRAEAAERERDDYAVLAEERRRFILNGVELGYIQVPTAKFDPAIKTFERCNTVTKYSISRYETEQQIKALEGLLNRTCPVSGPVIRDQESRNIIQEEIEQLHKEKGE